MDGDQNNPSILSTFCNATTNNPFYLRNSFSCPFIGDVVATATVA